MIIYILDFTFCVIVLIGLYIIPTQKKGWVLYAVGCLFYMGLSVQKGLFFAGFLNIVAAFIGIRNYIKEKK